ncbi:hypothetical protein [Salinarimonas ramus]|uniref:Uncharacterized protein n=1 Tax=Salinarimonas ramus TaxID=690164 RepID=A0A917QBP4_9HYPH|nr:hypothetical protein [Salinarimonas ramus]GGK39116.1 hypothetical protein GCM10011322_27730 [Salinarimonas ramus]
MLAFGLLDLWKVRAGRRAAVSLLSPFVARSQARLAARRADAGTREPTTAVGLGALGRLGGLDRLAGLGDVEDTSDSVWLDPYLVGFLATLITLVAKRKTGPLNEEALASVQEGAFSALTGLDGGLFGVELVLAGQSPSRAFAEGCLDGGRFYALLTGDAPPRGDAETPDWAAGFFHQPPPEPALAVESAATAALTPFDAWDAFVEPRLGA